MQIRSTAHDAFPGFTNVSVKNCIIPACYRASLGLKPKTAIYEAMRTRLSHAGRLSLHFPVEPQSH